MNQTVCATLHSHSDTSFIQLSTLEGDLLFGVEFPSDHHPFPAVLDVLRYTEGKGYTFDPGPHFPTSWPSAIDHWASIPIIDGDERLTTLYYIHTRGSMYATLDSFGGDGVYINESSETLSCGEALDRLHDYFRSQHIRAWI